MKDAIFLVLVVIIYIFSNLSLLLGKDDFYIEVVVV